MLDIYLTMPNTSNMTINYLKAGFPMATGVIEGACGHLIQDRMDITGARWTMRGAETVLPLGSLYITGDWDEYWQFHL